MTEIQQPYLKLYIAVLDEVPDFMVPTLVAHSMLGAHIYFHDTLRHPTYDEWLATSFRKCVIRVNRKEFAKLVIPMEDRYFGHENTTLGGEKSCIIPLPVYSNQIPNVLKFAKLWKPKDTPKEPMCPTSMIGDEGGYYKQPHHTKE